MAEENIDDLKKLPLKERLEKLKEFEEKRKKELEEASKLREQSIEEGRREKVAESIEVPEQKQTDISDLFKTDEKTLEAFVSRSAPPDADEDTFKYELMVDYKLLHEMPEHMDAYQLQESLQKVQDRINDIASKMDYANMSKDVADQLVATRSVLYSMKKKAGM